MCGRFTLTTTADGLADAFGLAGPVPSLAPRYNVAPGQVVAVVGLKSDGTRRGLALLRWGLVPRWAKDPKAGPKPINARAETVRTSPAFRESFRLRRCVIPADGFYEWHPGPPKAPYHFRPADGRPLGLAGLWDLWEGPDGSKLATCCVLTVPANEAVGPVHGRMPLVLDPADYAHWLDPGTPATGVAALLRPCPADRLEALPVGPAVNRVANDGPECVTPAA
jgi:putative SOS response-associated peptidase YedK